jgi:hypothetical protein
LKKLNEKSANTADMSPCPEAMITMQCCHAALVAANIPGQRYIHSMILRRRNAVVIVSV